MTPPIMRFVAIFKGNAQHTISVITRTISCQIIIACTNEMHGKERGGEILTEMRLEGVIWKGEGAVDWEDQAKFIFSIWKGKKVV